MYKDTTWYSSYHSGSYRSGVIKYNNQTLHCLYIEFASVYVTVTTISTTAITTSKNAQMIDVRIIDPAICMITDSGVNKVLFIGGLATATNTLF